MAGRGGYVLYGGDPTRSMMVEMVLAEGGIAYELRPIDIRAGAHRTPEFLAINPFGWVPVLVTPEGETIAETPAINLWLCERHGLGLVPLPGDPGRGRFLTAFHNVTGEIEPTLKRIFFAHRYALEPAQTEATRDLAWTMLAQRLKPIDQWLAGEGPYFLGERFTLADLTLTYWMPHVAHRGLLGEFPAVARAFDLVRARPALADAFARYAARLAG